MAKAKLTFEIGRLYISSFRDFLNKCKFDGMNIEFIEGGGWFSREFHIKGESSDLEHIKKEVERLPFDED